MIFAAIGEELGLLGATAVLAAFMFFVSSGFRVAASANQPFEKLLATGLTALLGFQAFIIIGGVLRVLPLTGVTLPFVSYGGSSLISNYVILALLVRISDSSARSAAAAAAATAQPVPVGAG
jgi:cell division protein FtsW (lipid II flippase)